MLGDKLGKKGAWRSFPKKVFGEFLKMKTLVLTKGQILKSFSVTATLKFEILYEECFGKIGGWLFWSKPDPLFPKGPLWIRIRF